MILVEASEIIPGLWQGSFPEPGPEVAKSGFTLLILCAQEYQMADEDYPGVRVIRAPNQDDSTPLSRNRLKIALDAAREAADELRAGGKVLSTCAAGLNRSGLVTGITLHLYKGWDGDKCIQHVRNQRGDRHGLKALFNPIFAKAIKKISLNKKLPDGWAETPAGLILPKE